MVKAVKAALKKVVKKVATAAPKAKAAPKATANVHTAAGAHAGKKLSTKALTKAGGAAKKSGKNSDSDTPPAVVALLEANPFCSIILVEDEEGKKGTKPLLLIVKVRFFCWDYGSANSRFLPKRSQHLPRATGRHRFISAVGDGCTEDYRNACGRCSHTLVIYALWRRR